MISWGSLTLQVFCMFVCSLYLTEAGCKNRFDPDYWHPEITYGNFKESVPLVDADSFQDVIWCTLKTAKQKEGIWKSLWDDCIEENPVPWASAGPCGEELKPVSFFDLLCLVAKASNITTQVCSHDVVVELYSNKTKTLSTTKQPSTTTKLTTATANPTTAEKTTKNNPPPMTAWSSTTSASSTASQDIPGNPSASTGQQEVTYSLLGVSMLINLLLAFCVALLCSQKRALHRKLDQQLRGENLTTAHLTDNGL